MIPKRLTIRLDTIQENITLQPIHWLLDLTFLESNSFICQLLDIFVFSEGLETVELDRFV